jgi:RNA polymerase sigma-70 factor (ECF subfamily)
LTCQDVGVADGRADGLTEYGRHRRHLFGIAYRMLGSVADVEEVLQEAWLRWQGADRAEVAEPAAFLTRVVTNLCLNQLTSARARREVYAGPWLPEPVLTRSGADRPGDLDPLEVIAQRDTVSFALLTVLERLSPAERAAYVLREAFVYSHRDIAGIIGTTEANARQLHSRARRHVRQERTRRHVDPAEWRALVERFLAAARVGDVAGLEALLADGVVSRADGGGQVTAARAPVQGSEKVARYLVGALRRFGAGIVPRIAEANGEPVIMGTSGEALRAICFVRIEDERIAGLEVVMSPAKLAFAERQLSRNGGPAGQGW